MINLKKLIPMIIVHLFEIAVVYFVVTWIIGNAPSNYAWPAAVLFAVVYVMYLVSSLLDDYKEYHKGVFDW